MLFLGYARVILTYLTIGSSDVDIKLLKNAKSIKFGEIRFLI